MDPLSPWLGIAGGLLIGGAATVLLLLSGRIAGVSGMLAAASGIMRDAVKACGCICRRSSHRGAARCLVRARASHRDHFFGIRARRRGASRRLWHAPRQWLHERPRRLWCRAPVASIACRNGYLRRDRDRDGVRCGSCHGGLKSWPACLPHCSRGRCSAPASYYRT
jgi:hypothetical protein